MLADARLPAARLTFAIASARVCGQGLRRIEGNQPVVDLQHLRLQNQDACQQVLWEGKRASDSTVASVVV
ncbi:MAG: hypothetical protein ABSG59_16545 [Verrucomicrobiota bacterium]